MTAVVPVRGSNGAKVRVLRRRYFAIAQTLDRNWYLLEILPPVGRGNHVTKRRFIRILCEAREWDREMEHLVAYWDADDKTLACVVERDEIKCLSQ